jgi:hypothetical protein
LTTAACGGLRSAPDCRTRRALLHLSYSYATPFGPAVLVTQGHQETRRPREPSRQVYIRNRTNAAAGDRICHCLTGSTRCARRHLGSVRQIARPGREIGAVELLVQRRGKWSAAERWLAQYPRDLQSDRVFTDAVGLMSYATDIPKGDVRYAPAARRLKTGSVCLAAACEYMLT